MLENAAIAKICTFPILTLKNPKNIPFFRYLVESPDAGQAGGEGGGGGGGAEKGQHLKGEGEKYFHIIISKHAGGTYNF